MKKLVIGSLSFLLIAGVQAQSVDEGNRDLFYRKYHSAQKAFEGAVQQDPNNVNAIYGLTYTDLALGENDKAAQVVSQAPAAVQEDPWYMVAKGTALLAQNKKDEATAQFRAAMKETKEKKPEILIAIASSLVQSENGDANFAIEALTKAIKKDKKNPAIYVLMGDAYRKAGNSSEAYKAYKQAIDFNSEYAPAYHEIADIFLSQKNEEMYMEYFEKALDADMNYTPTLEKLYAYYFYKDPARALDYYSRYSANADAGIRQNYDLADLYYINKKYDEAIQKANAVIVEDGEKTKPRIYKLLGYSYASKTDSAQALSYMKKYFENAEDSTLIVKDFQIMGDLLVAAKDTAAAMEYLTKATEVGKEKKELFETYMKLALLAEAKDDFAASGKWMGLYYTDNPAATNVDLFKWALAHYRGGEYEKAVEVFTKYTDQYPDQAYGFYWLARANAALDSEMEQGLAVPHYQKLIELLEKDTTNPNYKSWMLEAYAFLAAYQANAVKDYAKAINYFEKVLEIDPGNQDAQRYISILEKAEAGG